MVGFSPTLKIKIMSEKLELELEKSQLIGELLFIENEIDILWRYHPDNPNVVNITKVMKGLKLLKEKIEEKLEYPNSEVSG